MRFVKLAAVVLVGASSSDAYCWQPGWNPTFTGPPVVTQESILSTPILPKAF
jgi:hypothetical protein